MKRKRHSDEQIAFALRRADGGACCCAGKAGL